MNFWKVPGERFNRLLKKLVSAKEAGCYKTYAFPFDAELENLLYKKGFTVVTQKVRKDYWTVVAL